MKITEFINKYEFHDSSLLKVKYENNQLVLTVEFCFWMQSWFDEKSLNNGKIMVIFNNVSSFDYDDNIADKLLTDILDSEIFDVDFKNDILTFYLSEAADDLNQNEIFYQIYIKSDSVDVIELERYNL